MISRISIALCITFAMTSGPLASQVTNDTCATAIGISEGIAIVGTNVGATIGPDPVGCNAQSDVWYSVILNCSGQYVASTCVAGTNFDTVLSVWSTPVGCGTLTLVGCNDNNCPMPGLASASRVNFTGTSGALYFISVGGKFAATGAFSLQVAVNPVMTLTFSDLGPGTIGYYITGPPNGAFFLAVTLAPGAFPFGWFYGIDMPLFDIVAQYNFGPPFVGGFSICGIASLGPVGGAPSGVTLYAVALGFAAGATMPGFASNPTFATIP